MPLFTYTALQPDGQRVSGTMESYSLQSAHDALRQIHLIPEEIHESLPSEQPLSPEQAEKLLSFTAPVSADQAAQDPVPPDASSATAAEPSLPTASTTPPQSPSSYFPLLDTLRLYAGWLLAWYCLVYALGSYQHTRPLPFRIPFVEGLFLSPLVLSFTWAAFLFLLLSGIWKHAGKGVIKGMLALSAGIAGFVLYRMNVI